MEPDVDMSSDRQSRYMATVGRQRWILVKQLKMPNVLIR